MSHDCEHVSQMLYPEDFFAIYGHGAKVYDAKDRLLTAVAACNLDTGEVITYEQLWIAYAWGWLRWGHWPCSLSDWRRLGFLGLRFPGESCLVTRHGFWPAPLQIVPNVANVESSTRPND